MLPLTADTLQTELETARDILTRRLEVLKSGIPSLDTPGSEDAFDTFIREMCGELRACAGKCENLADILSGD